MSTWRDAWSDTPLAWSILPQDMAFVRVALSDWCVRERKRLDDYEAEMQAAADEDDEDGAGNYGEMYALQDEWARLQRCERMVAETNDLFPEGVTVSDLGTLKFTQAAHDSLQRPGPVCGWCGARGNDPHIPEKHLGIPPRKLKPCF